MIKTFIIVLVLSICRRPLLVSGFRVGTAHRSPPGCLTALTMARKGTKKRKASTTAASATCTDSKKLDTKETSILSEWVNHIDASFHDFSPTQAEQIRDELLSWYRANRRKLPWRGDPPPYDGSTAGIASNGATSKSRKKQADDAKSQRSIRNFFATTTNSSSTTQQHEEEKKEEENPSAEDETGALEVTGYAIWVSEIMLQQTRVEAVIPYYLKWMKRFPTVHDLAAASEEDVNAHWAGLGFYRRARLLHKGAKTVVEHYKGELPRTVEELKKIDGIGQYTASAIASIAFDVCVPVVDGNVCRVLSRLRGIANHIKAPALKDDIGWELAKQITSAGDGMHAGEVNQAIMELGATYCAPSGSGIDDRDPLKKFYMSTKLGQAFADEVVIHGKPALDSFSIDNYLSEKNTSVQGPCKCRLCDPEGITAVVNDISNAFDSLDDQIDSMSAARAGHSVFPLPPPKKTKREEVLAVAVIKTTKDDRWLLVKRPKDGLLAGQWEFPSVCMWKSDEKGNKKNRGASGNPKDRPQAVPVVDPPTRLEALNAFLDKVLTDREGFPVNDWIRQCSRENVGSKPIEHIFSHVRHTMWIEYGEAPDSVDIGARIEAWTTTDGKEARMMTEDDMKKVGVTSGVKKILKLVKAR